MIDCRLRMRCYAVSLERHHDCLDCKCAAENSLRYFPAPVILIQKLLQIRLAFHFLLKLPDSGAVTNRFGSLQKAICLVKTIFISLGNPRK